MGENDGLFHQLKELGRKIKLNDDSVDGVRLTVFFNDGKLYEYNSKQDKNLQEDK